MAKMTEEEFREKLDIVKEKYEIEEEELQNIIKETKKDIMKYYKMPEDKIPLINIFMKIKGVLDRQKLTGGNPHLISIIRDSGAFETYAKKPVEIKINRAAWKENKNKAISKGLVTPEGDPIDNFGKVHKPRKMRILTVAVIALDEEGNPNSKPLIVTASIWDKEAIKFNSKYFEWFETKGRFSTDGNYFNFNSSVMKKPKIDGLKSIYEIIISKRKMQISNSEHIVYVTLDGIAKFYEKCKKNYIPIKSGEIEESVDYVLVEANATQILNESIVQRGIKEAIRVNMRDNLVDDNKEILRVAIPLYIPINFTEDSRIAVVGKIRSVSEEYGGGWSIWTVESVYPIPGMSFLFEEENAPLLPVHGVEMESVGEEVVKPEKLEEKKIEEKKIEEKKIIKTKVKNETNVEVENNNINKDIIDW